MRSALVLIALLLAACEETIVLGTECPARNGPCEKKLPPPDDGDEGGSMVDEGDSGGDSSKPGADGGIDDPGLLDAGDGDSGRSPRDGSVMPAQDARAQEDAGPALFPRFRNPSFELIDGGEEGSLSFTPMSGSALVDTSISPWTTCRAGLSVSSSVSGFNQPTITPREGRTLLTDTFPIVYMNLNGLFQELEEPLVPAQRYAFAVDVFLQLPTILQQNAAVSEYFFEMQAAVDPLGCLQGRRLATSSSIEPNAWKTVCMHFTTPPQQAIRDVMILVNSPSPVNVASLHIDNMRYDAKCAYCTDSVCDYP